MAIEPTTSAEAGPSRLGPVADSPPSTASFETFTRPPFRPAHVKPETPSSLHASTPAYIDTFAHPVHFSRASFFAAIKDLAVHPERNSALILRADPLPPRGDLAVDEEMARLGLVRREEVRVRLMPKQVKRDSRLDQRVTFYEEIREWNKQGGGGRAVVLMCPEVKDVTEVPFFHPPVRKVAFIYDPIDADSGEDVDKEGERDPYPIKATFSIAYLPFDPPIRSSTTADALSDSTPPAAPALGLGVRPLRSPRKRSPLAAAPIGAATDEPVRPPAVVLGSETTARPAANPLDAAKPLGAAKPLDEAAIAHRTSQTCKLLLEKVYKHAYGNMVGYQKRVHHDVVVNRESFQDLYLVLKDRHRHLDSRVTKAHRVEDVKRHVWKQSDTSLPCDPSLPTDDLSHWGMQDVAIATFLMLLWREMYPARTSTDDTSGHLDSEVREWDLWGRPPGGFIDLGCGNGLLVHILTAEGYTGKGYELRARKTWPNYPPITREALVEYPIAFPEWFPVSMEEWDRGEWSGSDQCPIKEGCFIIGNHADEITPWIPLLSLLPSTPVPFLSLPCCLHTLDGAFGSLMFDPPPHAHMPAGGLGQGLGEGHSRYKAYLMWLGWCGLQCGWEWEKEGLRVPSTRGWGIVGRSRWTRGGDEEKACRAWALEQVQGVRQRGMFKVREKEGKEGH